MRRWLIIIGALALALGSSLAVVPGVSAKGGGGDVSAQLTTQTITSAGPLTSIYLTNELNCQVAHTGDSSFEFFNPSVTVGACATLIATGGTLYGPSSIPAGGGASPRTTYTAVSQTAVTGSGSGADPFTVTTVVDAGTSGLRLTETDSYIVGTETYRTDVEVHNTDDASHDFILYRAGDCFLQNSDNGFGDLLPNGQVGCRASDDGGATPGQRIERWIPITGGSAAYEAGFDDVWAQIGNQDAFPNTCLCTDYIDNGAGLSWSSTLAAGASATFSHFTVFSPLGVTGLQLSKTAASDAVNAGGSDSYTITVSNPTGGAVTLTSITDHLPAGFSYVAGTTTGLTTSEPTVNGQNVTWSGSFSIAAGSTATLTFQVTVSTVAGTYTNSADGTATGTDVTGVQDTAPVTIIPVIQPAFTG
jgi:uncharacterized repeat protein (TIGR01451 family)